MRITTCLAVVVLGLVSASAKGEPARKTENIIFVMLDGLRWQEVFTGAEESLLNGDRGGVKDVAAIKEKFWRDTPDERRQALLPFLWNTVGKEGQIYGNSRKGSTGKVTNSMHFSYPGYSEVLCGFPDDTINSNDKHYNRNVTVLEWLNRKPEIAGRVAAFSSWDAFPFIINTERSGIPVNGGFAPLEGITPTGEVKLLNRLMTETPLYGDATRFDAFTYHSALLYLKEKKPRILFLSFDETDAQGHAGRYDRVLASAHRNDGFIADLWQTIQSMPEYAGKTGLVITTDHGRGDPPVDWKNHSAKIPGSDYIWAAFLGPDTPARGEQKEGSEFTQSQIAATIAQLLGYDYNADVPKAAPAIADVTGQSAP